MNEALTQGFGSIACSDQKRSAAYLGTLPAKESICVTQPFQPENCPNCHPTKICGLHSSEALEAFVNYSLKYMYEVSLTQYYMKREESPIKKYFYPFYSQSPLCFVELYSLPLFFQHIG